jgi:hypothetical protein
MIRQRTFVKVIGIVLLTLAMVAVMAVAYLRIAAVPFRSDDGWFDAEVKKGEISDAEPGANLKWLIIRAELDHFIAPSKLTSRRIGFTHAWRSEPDRLYLGFVGENPHSLVIYCYGRRDQKLRWKATVNRSG